MSDPTPFPTLATDRLILREMHPEDAADILAVAGDDDVMRTYDQDTLRDRPEAVQFILLQRQRFEKGIATRWAIALRAESKVIGWCGYTPGIHLKAEVGYALAKTHWCSGYASEALQAVIRFVFESTSLNRLEAVTHPHNTASSRVLKKAGFKTEGLLRDYGFWRGEFHDMEIHSLLRSDLHQERV